MEREFVEVVEWGPTNWDLGGTGYRGPSWGDVVAHLPEFPELEIGARITFIDGVYEVTELKLSRDGAPAPFTSSLLRQIPLRTLVRLAMGPNLRSLNIGQVISPEPRDQDPKMTELRNVAQRYRIARLVGNPPIDEVAKALKVSRATAVRRIAKAREQKLLGPEESGSTGGAPSRLGN